jgi:hypothetical protein
MGAVETPNAPVTRPCYTSGTYQGDAQQSLVTLMKDTQIIDTMKVCRPTRAT